MDIEIIVTPVSNKDWKLLKAISLVVYDKKWDIPEGFITDFASIPKVFHGVFGPWNTKHGPAAILHDFLYQDRVVPRDEADDIFRECMRIRGVGWFKRNLFYAAVRGFGQATYDDTGRGKKLRIGPYHR